MNWITRFFQLREHGVTVRTEMVAGLTTFAAMAYILAVNPSILATTGMDRGALITGTALAAAVGCFIMAGLTNYPIALAPGMGTNAYFAFVICLGMNVPWQAALSLVFWNGLAFLVLSVTGLRRQLAESLPNGVKIGIQCGIGFFIAFIGLKNVGIIIQNDATFVSIGEVTDPGPLLVMVGVIFMVFLTLRKVPGAILLSIIGVSLIGLFLSGADGEKLTSVPDGVVSMPQNYGSIFGQLDILYPFRFFTEALPVILTLLILDLFDSIGTLVGLSHRANLVDKNGKMPKMGKALSADAIATMTGAIFGTSTTTSYIESAAGVESGGRTGLTSAVVGVCFLLSIFLTPIIIAIPVVATAPALVMVGIFMAKGLERLAFDDLTETAPAFLTMLMIPLTFSITEGIGVGLLVFVAVKLLMGHGREVPWLTWLVSVLFVIYYAFG